MHVDKPDLFVLAPFPFQLIITPQKVNSFQIIVSYDELTSVTAKLLCNMAHRLLDLLFDLLSCYLPLLGEKCKK
jgi:hypothetical protein